MELWNYQRREKLIESAGNVPVNLPTGNRELEGLFNEITEIGFMGKKQSLQAEEMFQLSNAQLAVEEKFQDFVKGLDINDTASYKPTLEQLQNTYPEIEEKITNQRARAKFAVILPETKLYQKKYIEQKRLSDDARNFIAGHNINVDRSQALAAVEPDDTQSNRIITENLKSLFGVSLIDPSKEPDKNNIEIDPYYDNPIFGDIKWSKQYRLDLAKSYITKAAEKRETYQHNLEFNEAVKYVTAEATRENSIKIINDLIDSGGTWDLFPRLQTDDFISLRREYEANKKYSDYAKTKNREKLEEEIEFEARKYAITRIDENGNEIPPDFQKGAQIINSAFFDYEELDTDWQTDALNKFKNAFSILNSTGENPFEKTQNWGKYAEIRQRIIDRDKNINEREIEKWTGRSDGYSTKEETKLLNYYKGKESISKALEDSAAGKLLDDLWSGYGRERWQFEPEEAHRTNWLKEESLRIFENSLDTKDDMTDRQKKEEAMRIYLNLKERVEAGEIEFVPEKLTGAEDNRILNIVKEAFRTSPDIKSADKKAQGDLISSGLAKNEEQAKKMVLDAVVSMPAIKKPSGVKVPKTAKKKGKVLRTAINHETGERIGWDGEKWINL